MNRAGVYLLFFFSGIAGLVYQVVWVRQFGNIFGNTIHSAALVTGVFMSGLGIGGYLAGRWGDRKYRQDPRSLLRAYAHFEVGIAAFGILIAIVLPRIEPLSAAISSYVQTADGWSALSLPSHVFRYLLAVVLLLPTTILMGGTLSLLIRHLVRSDLSHAGLRVGALYGVNAAGAAVGAFLVDFSFVPGVGLFATQSLAVLINLVVGVIALRWSARIASAPAGGDPASAAPGADGVPAPRPRGVQGAAARRIVLLTGAALFLSGFAAMGMEIIWFRFLSTVLGSHRATFSLLLTVILLAIWLGSTAGGWLHRRTGHAAHLFVLAQGAFVLSAVLIFISYDQTLFTATMTRELRVGSLTLWQRLVETWAQLRLILVVVGLPALLMGFSYPLANANVQRAEDSVGRRAGLLYLANTIGAVAGSVVAGFVLLPRGGLHLSVTVLAACGIAPVIPLYLSMTRGETRSGSTRARSRALKFIGAATAGAAVVATISWGRLPWYHLARKTYRPADATEKLLTLSEGVNESIVITELPGKGNARRLYTNGHSMSDTSYYGQRYMRAFVHLPLLQSDSPARVLVICFGVGNTLHAASLHGRVKRLEIAELSRNVLQHARYFARWNRNVLADRRVAVFINDGRQHLRMQPPRTYDLVTLEPPPIIYAGVSALYSREFYQLVHDRLRDGGTLTQWLPAYQVPAHITSAMVRAFLDVFPDAVLLSGNRAELILVGRRGGPPTFDPAGVLRRLAARPAVRADLRRIDLASLVEMVGTYAGSKASLRRAAGDMPPVTDDLPLMEYGPVLIRDTVIPAALFDTDSVQGWCPTCFQARAPGAALADLPTYLAFMKALYASPAFRATALMRQVHDGMKIPAGQQDVDRVHGRSRYLRRLFRNPRGR